MQPEMQAVVLAGCGDASAAGVIEALHRVGRNVGLGVEIEHAVLRRPRDRVVERDAAAEVDANAILETHRFSPARGKLECCS
jgi:hypothetical protein